MMQSLNELIDINEHRAACPECRTNVKADGDAQRGHDRETFDAVLTALECGGSTAASVDGLTGRITGFKPESAEVWFDPDDRGLPSGFKAAKDVFVPVFSRTLADIILQAKA